MMQGIRSIPTTAKPPPVPQAKPVPYAARNTAFSVTTGTGGRLSTTARTRTPADASAATQKRLEAAAAATRTAPVWECAIFAEGVTTAVTHGARGRLTATARTARTPADARAATKRRPKAAAAARPAPVRECAPLAEGVTTAITNGQIRRTPPLATARTASFACAAA